MPIRRYGAHVSISGGLESAARATLDAGANAFQIFTRSPRMWRTAPLDSGEVARFKAFRAERGLRPLVVHASYLINLAAADDEARARAVAGFREELERAAAIGADYLVLHPGSAKNQTVDEAIDRLAAGFTEAVRGLDAGPVTVLLENTVGGGASLGRPFDELGRIACSIRRRARKIPLGCCLDTAHTFAGGCDIATAAGLDQTLDAIDRELGLEAVRVIHFNDSKTKLGSRVDRHARLGEGCLGREALQRIARHPRLADKPLILETPVDPDGTHRIGVAALRAMLGLEPIH